MTESPVNRAVVLLSGGLDSATVLAMAREAGHECYALSVHYGQRHSIELEAAAKIAALFGAREHRVMGVDLAGIGGSALTDAAIRYVDSHQQDPFFLFISYLEPHHQNHLDERIRIPHPKQT